LIIDEVIASSERELAPRSYGIARQKFVHVAQLDDGFWFGDRDTGTLGAKLRAKY
jgi:hypothetical protein